MLPDLRYKIQGKFIYLLLNSKTLTSKIYYIILFYNFLSCLTLF